MAKVTLHTDRVEYRTPGVRWLPAVAGEYSLPLTWHVNSVALARVGEALHRPDAPDTGSSEPFRFGWASEHVTPRAAKAVVETRAVWRTAT